MLYFSNTAKKGRNLYITCLLSVSVIAIVPWKSAADELIPYAQIKTGTRYVVARDTLNWVCHSRFPFRGVVISFGSFLTRSATFYIVDIDKKAIRKIEINSPTLVVGQPPQSKQVVWFDGSAELSANELNTIIERMNQIWIDGVSHEFEMQPTDVTNDMLLLDGDVVFKDEGYPTHGLDKALMATISALEQSHDLAPKRGVSTDIPCDPVQLP